MTIKDYIYIGFLLAWVVCIIGATALGKVRVKTVKEQRLVDTAKRLMDYYVAYYDQQQITNPEKLSGAINDVVKALKAKGYSVSDQDLRNVEAGVECAVASLHAKKVASDPNPKKPTEIEAEEPPIVTNINGN